MQQDVKGELMKVYCDFSISETPFKAFGELLFDGTQQFIASSTLHSMDELKTVNKIMYCKIPDFSVVGADGYKYCFYKSRVVSISERFTKSCIIADITIYYEMIVQQSSHDCKYNQCSFTFDHIENLFPLESFETSPTTEDTDLAFHKKVNKVPFEDIGKGLSFKVESEFDGICKSDSLFQLNVTQTKQVYIQWNSEVDANSIVAVIYKVKQYFEIICHRELHIKDIKLYGKNYNELSQIEYSFLDKLGNAEILNNKIKYVGTYKDIITGLKGWMEKYSLLAVGIELWLKQIYNPHIDRSDIILWNCQTIEAIGECIPEIKTDAQKTMDRRTKKPGQYPNLFAFLKAINKRYNYFKDIDDAYLFDAKEVRNKITHNNPQKAVSEQQLKNTEALVKNWSVKLICSVIGLNGLSSSMSLIPKDFPKS